VEWYQFAFKQVTSFLVGWASCLSSCPCSRTVGPASVPVVRESPAGTPALPGSESGVTDGRQDAYPQYPVQDCYLFDGALV
ncbi:MAG: hypothetical protein WBG50_03140, partial [Desulfomonilaceae bacterium]